MGICWVLGVSRLKIPCQKGFNNFLMALSLPKIVFKCLVSMSAPTCFNLDFVLVGNHKTKKIDQNHTFDRFFLFVVYAFSF